MRGASSYIPVEGVSHATSEHCAGTQHNTQQPFGTRCNTGNGDLQRYAGNGSGMRVRRRSRSGAMIVQRRNLVGMIYSACVELQMCIVRASEHWNGFVLCSLPFKRYHIHQSGPQEHTNWTEAICNTDGAWKITLPPAAYSKDQHGQVTRVKRASRRTNSVAFSPRVKYSDRATAACLRS
jgi:hypothetical protein